MARDSADLVTFPRRTSAHDTVQQLSSNLSRLSHLGTSLWESTRNRLRHKKSPYQKQRANVLKWKYKRGLPLLGMRRRALTLPLPDKGNGEAPQDFSQKTADQSSSGLCTRLPFEVRRLIFELVVAGESNVVHVFKRSKKMGHWRCRRQLGGLPCTWIDPCSKALPFKAMIMDENGVLISGDPSMQRYFDRSKIVPSKKDKDIGVFSLLCTCRQTYSETISLLYAKTHFHFPGITDILDFSQNVLPDRFDSIRVLSVDWEPNPFFISSTPQMRVQSWDKISKIRDLQELRVFIKTLCILPDSSAARALKQNLRKVRGIQKFELVVTKDQFPVWDGFLDEGMEVTLVVYTGVRADRTFLPLAARTVRAY